MKKKTMVNISTLLFIEESNVYWINGGDLFLNSFFEHTSWEMFAVFSHRGVEQVWIGYLQKNIVVAMQYKKDKQMERNLKIVFFFS